ncbi:hypothetical protein [Hansschlegelia zhihuaiae]|uniref:Uncharacterized protein n=1 Tax=Hansschlegelia zhihuaiae TaxID=405005 RepID=A0A4Q0M424_9HYPH|nr:hypothetical protein [Hansschlegelia zhihuaiae]RXF67681.1 hypothetical protein EK403_20990 [Hansschlegelia zhihuaiae]
MPDVPSDALPAAAATARALAALVARLSERLSTGRDADARCRGACGLASEDAAMIRSQADVGALAARLITAVQRLARAAEQGSVVRTFYATATEASTAAPSSASTILTQRFGLARALAAALECALLTEAFLAEGRAGAADRRAALDARARIRTAFDGAVDRIARELGPEAGELLTATAQRMSRHLAETAATLKPVVRVETATSYPPTALAWRLYGDPGRAGELLASARCGTPMFMPTVFEAPSPYAVAR